MAGMLAGSGSRTISRERAPSFRAAPRAARVLAVAYVAGGAATLAFATSAFEVRPAIALPFSIGGLDPTILGVALWTVVCLGSSSVGLAQSGRAVLVLAMGPLIAAAALGGPAAIAWVALVGTFELREVRGDVPWYGVLANHGQLVLAWTAGALVIAAIRMATGAEGGPLADFLAVLAGGAAASLLSTAMAIAAASARTARPAGAMLPIGAVQLAQLVSAEAALAWLAASAYAAAPWSPLLFLVIDTTAANSLGRLRADLDLRRDPLTDLPNGLSLDERVLELRRAPVSGVCVLYLDLDGFKTINDVHDHNVGDDVLRETGRRLAAACRDGDFLARLHGDEFVVFAQGIANEAEAHAFGRRLVAAVEPPIDHAAGELRVSATVGVRLVTDPAGLEDAIRQADSAMSRAKEARTAESGRTRARR